MKKVRILCVIVLAAVCVLGWLSLGRDAARQQASYSNYLSQAREYERLGLHQKAAGSYRSALAIQTDGDTLRELLEVTRKGAEEGTLSRDEHLGVLRELCALEPQNAAYWEALLESQVTEGRYDDARSTLGAIREAGTSSERITQLADQVNYAFTTKRQSFTQVLSGPNGYCTVSRGNSWGMTAPDGGMRYELGYEYVGPFGEQPVVLLRTPTRSQIVDGSGVVQANVERRDVTARGAGSGLMPLGGQEGWRYFDIARGTQWGELYQDASSFQNGVALVKQNDLWNFLDTSAQITDAGFQDVKLYGNGGYCLDDRMVAKREGYGLFTAAGAPVGELSAADMDVYMGGWIAFQNADGLWGYIDREGQVVVEPTYQKARSFSHGLAAVYDGRYWGFINEAGRWVIPARYVDALYFTAQGACLVDDGSGYRAIVLEFP